MLFRRIFKFTPLVLGLLLGLGGLRSQNLEILGEYSIALVGSSPEETIFWGLVHGAREQASVLEDRYSLEISIRVFMPESGDPMSQAAELSRISADTFDAVVIHPASLENEQITQLLIKLSGEGVQIVTVGRSFDGIPSLRSFPADEFAAAEMATRALSRMLVRPGLIGLLSAEDATEPWSTRREGVLSHLDAASVRERATVRTHRAAIETLRALHAEPDARTISGMLFLDDWPLAGDFPLFHDPSRVRVVSFMSSPTSVPSLRSGTIHALVAHPFEDWGREAVTTIIHEIHDRTTEPPTGESPEPRVYMRSDAEELAALWRRWLREGDVR